MAAYLDITQPIVRVRLPDLPTEPPGASARFVEKCRADEAARDPAVIIAALEDGAIPDDILTLALLSAAPTCPKIDDVLTALAKQYA